MKIRIRYEVNEEVFILWLLICSLVGLISVLKIMCLFMGFFRVLIGLFISFIKLNCFILIYCLLLELELLIVQLF